MREPAPRLAAPSLVFCVQRWSAADHERAQAVPGRFRVPWWPPVDHGMHDEGRWGEAPGRAD